MDIKLVVGLIGLVGVLTSALVQFYLGRQSEKNKKVIEIKTQAYLDLVNIVSEIASSARHGNQRNLEQLQKLTQAKSRVILIGSNNLVLKVHNFFVNHKALDSEDSFMAFSSIVQEMRKDLFGNSDIPEKLLTESLFGKKQMV